MEAIRNCATFPLRGLELSIVRVGGVIELETAHYISEWIVFIIRVPTIQTVVFCVILNCELKIYHLRTLFGKVCSPETIICVLIVDQLCPLVPYTWQLEIRWILTWIVYYLTAFEKIHIRIINVSSWLGNIIIVLGLIWTVVLIRLNTISIDTCVCDIWAITTFSFIEIGTVFGILDQTLITLIRCSWN